uniref:Uncharacterized protein n=1 Tax=Colletotrichum fructicola (strain Nara gc5) TaxID=1213859 RepID=L2FQJ9_COLFN
MPIVGEHAFSRAKNYAYPEALIDCVNQGDNVTYNIDANDFDCSYFGFCSCPRMTAEPDIAGRGVIFAFVFTAFVTLLTTIFCLVIGRTNEERQTMNPLDRFFRKHVSAPARNLMHRLHMNPDLQALVAYDLVNTLSDLQLVTGMAILVAGMKQLFEGTISTYHFMIVTDLAWFCSNTHLFSLLVITSMRDSVKRTHPERYNEQNMVLPRRMARALRIFFMATTVVLLLYALYVGGYAEIYEPGQFRCPMKCSLGLPKGGDPANLMIVNMVMMGYFYGVRIFMSSRTGRIFWMDHVRSRLIDNQTQQFNILQPEAVFVARWTENTAWRWCKAAFRGVWYFFASEVETIVGLMAYFSFGIQAVVDDRRIGHSEMEQDEKDEENSLMFSQLVPIFLLIIPFMGLFESYARHSVADRERRSKELDELDHDGPQRRAHRLARPPSCNSVATAVLPRITDAAPTLPVDVANYLALSASVTDPCSDPTITGSIGSAYSTYAKSFTSWKDAHMSDFRAVWQACSDVQGVATVLPLGTGQCSSLVAEITSAGPVNPGGGSGGGLGNGNGNGGGRPGRGRLVLLWLLRLWLALLLLLSTKGQMWG